MRAMVYHAAAHVKGVPGVSSAPGTQAVLSTQARCRGACSATAPQPTLPAVIPQPGPRKLQGASEAAEMTAASSRDLTNDALAVRAIAACVCTPGKPLSPRKIARLLKASEAEVRYVLRSPIYAELLREEIRNHSLGYMARCLNNLITIADDEKQLPPHRIAAAAEVRRFYETAAKVEPVHVEAKARSQFERLLDQLRRVHVDVKDQTDAKDQERTNGR